MTHLDECIFKMFRILLPEPSVHISDSLGIFCESRRGEAGEACTTVDVGSNERSQVNCSKSCVCALCIGEADTVD